MTIMPPQTTLRRLQNGFTLIEIAMVLFVVALLLGGLIPTLSGQIEQRRNGEVRQQLDEIKEALIGYAIINGRLPCPTDPAANTGLEDPVGGGNCSHFYDGYIPAVTLGLSGTDGSGNLEDPWGNPLRYAVTAWSSTSPAVSNVFTTASGMSQVGVSNLNPTLLVCSTATGIAASSCAAGTALTSSPGVPVVIFSSGKNGATGVSDADEAANLDANQTFVSHTPTPTFDDSMVWISPNVLVNRMVTAGRLP